MPPSSALLTSAPVTPAGSPALALASVALWDLAPEAVAEISALPELETIALDPTLAALRDALRPDHDFDVIAVRIRDPDEARVVERIVRAAPPRQAVLVVGSPVRLFADSSQLPYDIWAEPDPAAAAAIFVPLLRSVREREALLAIQAHRAIVAQLDTVLELDGELGDTVARAMAVIANGLRCGGASFWRPSASGATLTLVGGTGPDPALDRAAAGADHAPDPDRPWLREVQVDGTPVGEVLRTGRPHHPAGDPGAVLLPARANGRTCGVVVLCDAHAIARRRTSAELAVSAADRVSALVQAHLSAQQFKAVTTRSPLAIMLLDGRGFVVSYNHATEQLLGVARAEALDRHFTTLITPESRRLQADELQELIRSAAEERPKTTEITIRPVAAAPRVIELSTSTWGSGADRRYALIAQDVSERRRAEQQIAQLAYTHRVSGLPNEPALLAALARPAPTPRGFVALELSRLQRVREIFGSEGSDAVVRAVATRLGSGPAKVTAYHLTRAEFMLVVEDTDRCELQALAARACATLQAPLEVQGATLYLKYAAGTALVDARGDGRAGIDEALRGLQRARETDSPRPCFYDAADPPDRGRLRREADLHGAVSRGELCLHYQPIVELATGDVRAFEALVRWRHPELGLLPPAMFVDLAEESGLIVEIGRWVIDESCRQLAGWRRAHGFAGRMSFNVAPRQLLSDDLARVVAEATARHGVDPALLVAEVVESAALRDLSGARRTLESLRDLGMWIALDDFGAGESSLGRLADLPVQVLKLDRSLTRGLPDARASRAVTRSAAHLAHELGLSLVSEGVETDAQRGHLRGLPGRFAQGFLFGRPLPAADAIRLA